MCGIAGIFNPDGGRLIDPGTLQAMGDSMAHRGPDGEGHWLSPDHRIGLAHRRLAIVDLSNKALQPMTNADETVWVTFNGEIYNHAGLRRELQQAGHRFRTDHADTEVLVHGFVEWGLRGLLERLDGMFAFAVWDVKKQKLSLARDRIGIKPLYFTRHDGAFRFASEIKAILTDPAVPRGIEPQALNHYLSFMISPPPLTMFRGIYKLPAAHWLEVDAAGQMTSGRYWDAVPGKGIDPAETKGLSDAALEDFYCRGIRERLQTAIDKRMMSDVPFGVFLSGGIDSSATVALMSRLMDRPVQTFTVGFKDHPAQNELDWAARVAREYGAEHREVLIDEDDMTGYLNALVHQQDEPIADWVCIPLYFVSKLARESGVPVVQVGEGSDEQFSGYNSYAAYMRLHRSFWKPYRALTPAFLRRGVAGLAGALVPNGVRPLERVADILGRAAKGQDLFWGGAHAFWNIDKDRYLRPGAFSDGGGGWDDLDEAGLDTTGLAEPDSGGVINAYQTDLARGHPGTDFLNRMAYSEFRLRLPELLLMRVDKISMSTSIEGRVPFLDHRLVDFTMDIPMAWKVRGGESKYILKKTLSGIVPDDVLYRPKMGFGAPMREWLRGDFGRQAERRVLGSKLLDQGFFERQWIEGRFREHLEGHRDHALHLWMLFNLTSWYDHWIEGAPTPD